MSFRLLGYLFLLSVVVQFFLAGMGMSELGAEGFGAHRGFGFSVMHLLPLLMFGAAIWANLGRTTIVMAGVLFILVAIQSVFVLEDIESGAVRALHVVNALFIFMLAYHLVRRSGPPSTSEQP